LLQQMKALPQLRDVATDQQIAGTTATLTIDRDAAQRSVSSRNKSTIRCTMRSANAR